MVSILNKVGIDFKVLGRREKCCGYPLILLGDYDGFKALAKDVAGYYQ
jgi:Fe-S oxidoreductase